MASRSVKQLSTKQRKGWLSILRQSAAKKNHGEEGYSVVLDANVWLSGFIHGGVPEQVIVLALEQCNIIASESIIGEVFDYLRYHTRAPHVWAQKVRTELERICDVLLTDNFKDHQLRDPKDNHVLEAAIVGKSAFIVTGDKDLLEFGNYQGVVILRPSQFLDLAES